MTDPTHEEGAAAIADLPVALFDFDLPEALIALRPVRPRPSARMLVADLNGEHDRHAFDLPEILRPGDVLVFNDTKVLPVRLTGVRTRDGNEARIEATLIERLGPDRWRAFAKPGKRLKPGDRIVFSDALSAEVLAKADDGTITLDFPISGEALDAAIAGCGAMPLPPYIAAKRAPDAQDFDDYQTVMAREAGAVAAPTAALHFDADLLERLRAHGVGIETVTLHVGAGTFLPVKADSTGGHQMHSETGVITAETAQRIASARAAGGRIIAVGTTSLRVLETASRASGELTAWSGSTDIFITPGFAFKSIDGLITNFHLPRSTLFMLVSALMGTERMQSVYGHAISQKYRFFSYGDASLLLP